MMTTKLNLDSIAPTQIRTAGMAEKKYITASLVLAFTSDPVMRWMYPDSYQYLTNFPLFLHNFGGKAFTEDKAFCIDGYAGAALWLPPNVEPDMEPLIELFQQSVFESERGDLFAVFEQMGHYHPQEPHWYLSILGVEPARQRQGYGSALLQPVLEQCDQDGLLAYLESSNPANIPFYERHGFELMGMIQAGLSPIIFPMLRRPQ